MTWLRDMERAQLEAISRLAYCNPFLPERIEWERTVLGEAFVTAPPVWSHRFDLKASEVNVDRILEITGPLVHDLAGRLPAADPPTPDERRMFEDVVLFHLYHRYRHRLGETLHKSLKGRPARFEAWEEFRRELQQLLAPALGRAPTAAEGAHLVAGFYQIRRAFEHIYFFIVGGSLPAARLRAAVWQSVFTHDLTRYRRALYARMDDHPTLVIGPSGTGKELVARAIGLSRYIPFDPEGGRFVDDISRAFTPLNLSALSPTLIESELFGHCRGAFTGAVADRAGWLEQCPPRGAVFLDEIGELEAAIQVKLLRVLQTGAFQRLGETGERTFAGKIIAATNRDLAAEMRAGRFRRDFYYRLCADVVTTPSLREQLADNPADLDNLVRHLAGRIAGEAADDLAAEVLQWINGSLGREYAWPGNIRELEQCVRNVMIRREYHPPRAAEDSSPIDRWLRRAARGEFTAEELLRGYCTLVYLQTGAYEETARRLKLDRRTVKSKVDDALLAAWRG